MGVIKIFKDSWHMYTSKERRNIAFYILGIMLYKFGLEAFNGSIVTLATDRFKAMDTFTKLGALTGLNQAMQCVGAILIVPSLVLTLLTAGPFDQTLSYQDRSSCRDLFLCAHDCYSPNRRCSDRRQNQTTFR